MANQPPNSPGISFKIFISMNGLHAFAEVGIYYGYPTSYGYEFILDKSKAIWKVRTVASSWIE
jgi:hypothetical protein